MGNRDKWQVTVLVGTVYIQCIYHISIDFFNIVILISLNNFNNSKMTQYIEHLIQHIELISIWRCNRCFYSLRNLLSVYQRLRERSDVIKTKLVISIQKFDYMNKYHVTLDDFKRIDNIASFMMSPSTKIQDIFAKFHIGPAVWIIRISLAC